MADKAKKAPAKAKKFDPKKLLADIKAGTEQLPRDAVYRGAVKALVVAHNQLSNSIEADKKLK